MSAESQEVRIIELEKKLAEAEEKIRHLKSDYDLIFKWAKDCLEIASEARDLETKVADFIDDAYWSISAAKKRASAAIETAAET